MPKVNIRFRPLENETLAILYGTYVAEGKDPAASYSRLLSAAMMAGAVLELRPEQVRQQVDECYRHAMKAVKDRPDIFGSNEGE